MCVGGIGRKGHRINVSFVEIIELIHSMIAHTSLVPSLWPVVQRSEFKV